MERYANVSGNSGVVAFEIGADFIRVKFLDGGIYRYTYESAGESNVEEMKRLARAGRGLSGFISVSVREMYSRKERSRKER
jgi:hypothetical protein